MTQGQTERWRWTLKDCILLSNYYLPGDLERQIDTEFLHPLFIQKLSLLRR